MGGVPAGRWGSRALVALVGMAAWLPFAPRAHAIEAFEGRLQAHGFVEMQIRGLDDGFSEELDLAQWYNVLNVEIEGDIAPDGWAFFDLIQAYTRIEGRYDCIYTRGCGMFRSADAFGDRANHIPRRLRDGEDEDYGGAIQTEPNAPRIIDEKPAHWATYQMVPNPDFIDPSDPKCAGVPECLDPRYNPAEIPETIKRVGFPGFDTLFDRAGSDKLANTDDDPARYTFESVLDYRFYLIERPGAGGGAGTTRILGPVLPENFFTNNAALRDKANPFRGERPPNLRGNFRVDSVLDPRLAALDGDTPYGIRPRDPATESDDAGQATTIVFGTPRLDNEINVFGVDPNLGIFIGERNSEKFRGFSGDFSGIVPRVKPSFLDTEKTPIVTDAIRNQEGLSNLVNCSVFVPTGGCPDDPLGPQVFPPDPSAPWQNGLFDLLPNSNIKITAGQGELPMRPAPDRGNLEPSPNRNLVDAQGLYIPSRGLRHALATQDTDVHDFNIDETNRAWNRGSSQDDEKEFKEGYLDLELFDSRTWIRIGKQNIVWGKTELFRTTDQFNPQDFALGSLVSLEESRIALWSGRIVQSFYDVGPFEDVRVEAALNFDDIEPNDLGACGEPFTPDPVCQLTTGIMAHGLIGIGVAGVDRPPNPWQSTKGLEYGGRIEWRWSRFSFALTDFYGYDDFPYPDQISYYSRNVDLMTGRPLIMEMMEDAPGSCGNNPLAGPVSGTDPRLYTDAGAWQSMTPTGISRDPRCLKPGGAAGGANENQFDGVGTSPQNALENHHANVQFFSVFCSALIGISDLDPSSCAFNIFGSNVPADPAVAPFRLVEFIGSTFAGEGEMGIVIQAIQKTPRNDLGIRGEFAPLVPLNRDGGTSGPTPRDSVNCTGIGVPGLRCDPDVAGLWSLNGMGGVGTDGVITALDVNINKPNFDAGCFNNQTQLVGAPGNPNLIADCRIASFFNQLEDFLTLDNTLTNEQRALLGCGPFWGTRCDSADFVRDSTGVIRLPSGGGVDFLNADASFLLQSWVGIEFTSDADLTDAYMDQWENGITVGGDTNTLTNGAGEKPTWLTTSAAMAQPRAVNLGTGEMFRQGATCTYYNQRTGALTTLPGCRGIETFRVNHENLGDPSQITSFTVSFEDNYLPSIDGCVFGSSIAELPVSVVSRSGAPINVDTDSTDTGYEGELGRQLAACGDGESAFGSNSRVVTAIVLPFTPVGDTVIGAQVLYHPLAGCRTPGNLRTDGGPTAVRGVTQTDDGESCDVTLRDFVQNFENDPTSVEMFLSEGAALSFNVQMFLTVTSCQSDKAADIKRDPECFDLERPYHPGRCSLAAPQYCANVKGFLNLGGLMRNTVKAGGRNGVGRRTFPWHSGGELILRYEKRNVLGFSMDFAEDVTKSNWSAEFTWIAGAQFLDNNGFDNVSRADALNLTISVDRPTFINFLNANRTFFFNSQWFLQYISGYEKGFLANGPFNVLFTFAVFTGYFQDRLLPQFVSVYDFGSRSGGFLPSIGYRFTEAFSATLGFNIFFGRTQTRDMPIRGFGPSGNRAGIPELVYKDGVENVLSSVRKRDEIYMRLRWTF